MDGNVVDNKKCLEKLNQMERFLPFLDYMIAKIKRKSNELPLGCQLSKLQTLRSMIVEKSNRHTWEGIIKMEEVIKKLIEKLDYKDEYHPESKESKWGVNSPTGGRIVTHSTDLTDASGKMPTSIPIIPSSTTTTISVTNASDFTRVSTVDSRPQGANLNTVGLLMKTLKMSVNRQTTSYTNSDKGKETLSSPVGQNETETKDRSPSLDGTMETNLESTGGSKVSKGATTEESTWEGSEKVSSHVDLLSSSREKLLKSLERKLKPVRSDRGSPQTSTALGAEKTSDSQSISASSQSGSTGTGSRTGVVENKSKSGLTTKSGGANSNCERGKQNSNTENSLEKLLSVPLLSPQSLLTDILSPDDSADGDLVTGEYGKTAAETAKGTLGGTVRSTKVSGSRGSVEDGDAPLKTSGGSSSGSESGDKRCDKSGRSHSKGSSKEERDDRRSRDKSRSHRSSDNKKRDHRHSKSGPDTGSESRKKEGKSSEGSGCKSEPEVTDRNSEIENFNDDELAEFVKENMQSLPNLSKLNAVDVRKLCKSVFKTEGGQETGDNKADERVDTKVDVPHSAATRTGSKGSSEKVRETSGRMHKHGGEKGAEAQAKVCTVTGKAKPSGEDRTPGAAGNDVKDISKMASEKKSVIDDTKAIVNSVDRKRSVSSEGGKVKVKPEEVGSRESGNRRVSSDKSSGSEEKRVSNYCSLGKARSVPDGVVKPKGSENVQGSAGGKLPQVGDKSDFKKLNSVHGVKADKSSFPPGRDTRPVDGVPGKSPDDGPSQIVKSFNIFDTGPKPNSGNLPGKPKGLADIPLPKLTGGSDGKPFSPGATVQPNSQPKTVVHPRDPRRMKQVPPTQKDMGKTESPTWTPPVPGQSKPVQPGNPGLCQNKPVQPGNPGLCQNKPVQPGNPGLCQNKPVQPGNPGLCPNKPVQVANTGLCQSKPVPPANPGLYQGRPIQVLTSGVCQTQPGMEFHPGHSASYMPRNDYPNWGQRSGNVQENAYGQDQRPGALNDVSSSIGGPPNSEIHQGPNFRPNVPRPQFKQRQPGHYYQNRMPNPKFNQKFSKFGGMNIPEPKSYAEYKRLKMKLKELHRERNLVRAKIENERLAKSASPGATSVPGPASGSDEPETGPGSGSGLPGQKPEQKVSGPNVQPEGMLSKKKRKRKKKKPDNFVGVLVPMHVLKNTKQPQNSQDNRFATPPEKPKNPKPEIIRKDKDEPGKEKVPQDRRSSLDQDETVSPLDKLYQSEKTPKTGRGYGLQNFKIPKRAGANPRPGNVANDIQVIDSGAKSAETGVTEQKSTETQKNERKGTGPQMPEHTKPKETKQTTNSRVTVSETDVGSLIQKKTSKGTGNKADSNAKSENSTLNVDLSAGSKTGSSTSIAGKTSAKSPGKSTAKPAEKIIVGHKTSDSSQTKNPESTEPVVLATDNKQPAVETMQDTNNETKDTKDDESSVQAESDSAGPKPQTNVETEKAASEEPRPDVRADSQCKASDSGDSAHESKTKSSAEKADKPGTDDAESESLPENKGILDEVTKEFTDALITSSGEGKQLLANAKILKKLLSMLNTKALKAIEKIINEGGSSSSEESSSDESDKKKKSKSVKQGKKKRKKARKIKKLATTSESEQEDKEGEEAAKGENKLEQTKDRSDAEPTEGRVSVSNEETSQAPETSVAWQNETSSKERPVKRGKGKGKGKTELDRLHEDIKSMFISQGVITATGQRMCRILKNSGGNMNNVDLVKESAKMVKEERLRNMQNRKGSGKQSGGSCQDESRRSPVFRPGSSCDESVASEDADVKSIVLPENRHKRPCVVLHKIDLDGFRYGRKVSESCVAFKYTPGRNVAIRSRKLRPTVPASIGFEKAVGKVFLLRNKRKCEDGKGRRRGKRGVYVSKKLSDIIDKLPLKMAKMKHLEICSKKSESSAAKGGSSLRKSRNSSKKHKGRVVADVSPGKLLNHAFEKNKYMYTCKLCMHSTRTITLHYKNKHPDSEVLISRLTKKEAEKAMEDTALSDTSPVPAEQVPGPDGVKRRARSKAKKTMVYRCRMCNSAKITDLKLFTTHVCSHTGEYMHRCPSDNCTMTMATKESLRFHIYSKHNEERYDLYEKMIELFTVPLETGTLYGYMCSKCHYVQIQLSNLERHVQRYHSSEEDVSIVRIDMSSKSPKRGGKGRKETLTSPSEEWGNLESGDERLVDSPDADVLSSEQTKRKIREILGHSLSEADMEPPVKKLAELCPATDSVVKKLFREDEADDSVTAGEVNASQTVENVYDDKPFAEDLPNAEDMINSVEKSAKDIRDSVLASTSFCSGEAAGNTEEDTTIETKDLNLTAAEVQDSADQPTYKKLRVGPLEAQLLGNSAVLYECYVKGCIYSTKVFDLFEKHVKISHAKVKWAGVCEFCLESNVEDETKSSSNWKLTWALLHLKLHCGEPILSVANLKEEKRSPKKEIEEVFDGPEAGAQDIPPDTTTDENVKEGESQQVAESFPRIPLLRVRTLIGDRLSTPKEPKAYGSDVSAVGEDNSGCGLIDSNDGVNQDEPAMFQIKNVRSLNPTGTTVDSELHLEDLDGFSVVERSEAQAEMPATSVIVRSCPTPKIAIRSDSSAAIEVGTLQVVKTTTAASPVVLNSTSTTATNSMTSSTTTTTTTSTTTTATTGRKLSTGSRTKVYRPSLDGPGPGSGTGTPPAPAEARDPTADDSKSKDATSFQKLPKSDLGSKSVKDMKIYHEMLTKTKLCHLFKCMAIECSFTCNSENVFTQHIGLHEAQRRVKNNKAYKNFCLDSNNKLRRVFNWHQCAYCCEVLANTNFSLSRHILTEHGHCVYQCGYCFYRAVTQVYVEVHQSLVHGHIISNHAGVVYKCKPLSHAPPAATVLEKQGRRQCVRPYHCDQCGKKFYIPQEFMNHLTTEHQSVTAYTCHICKNLCFKAERLITHYKLHSYCTYQCPYCLHGTETQNEMVVHLCNFHFSQPPYIYMRDFAETPSDVGPKVTSKRKKPGANQLDSLKLIAYQTEKVTSNCIVDADTEEVTPSDDVSKVSDCHDLSAIAAELGITTESDPAAETVTPIMKELASIGNNKLKTLSVQTLLPNAQFSTENDSSAENCFVLISSGLNSSKDQCDEKDMSVPLGQLNLEVVPVNSKPSPTRTPADTVPDGSLRLNELLVNLNNKEKTLATVGTAADEGAGVATGTGKEGPPEVSSSSSSAFHKLPPVVLSRQTIPPKNVYAPKHVPASGKRSQDGDRLDDESNKKSAPVAVGGTRKSLDGDGTATATAITVSPLTPNKGDNFIKIAGVCSLSESDRGQRKSLDSSREPKAPPLQPPIIRVEDFTLDGRPTSVKKECEKGASERTGEDDPDVVIVDEGEKSKVLTVTIDSDEEKEVGDGGDDGSSSPPTSGVPKKTIPPKDIRKEMEELRDQIANETDCLLFDDTEEPSLPTSSRSAEGGNADKDGGVVASGDPVRKTLLSPIEEAICSLNKKLEEEGERSKREKQPGEDGSKPDDVRSSPRTRSSSARETRARRDHGVERSDSEDSNATGNSGTESGKTAFKVGLMGKELYICGNDKCNFAADGDAELKDHLLICDFSRDSTHLVCPHCFKPSKLFNTYIEHLKHHGEKKFACGLCTFTSAVEGSVARHMKVKHKSGQLKSVPREPAKDGHLVFYPKNYKLEKQDFKLNGYSPGDEDKLPLQSVYQVNVKCAKCPYYTKVRSNMVRHLKIHVKSAEAEGTVVVPSTAPTNPVPCLDTKERMFDKMTNLAASSQLAQAKEKTAIEALSPEDQAKMPQLVTEQLRYKCCLPDCNYITVDDSMLKHHIKALHDELTHYSCPHCSDTVHVDVRNVTLDKIGYHLKHHDAKLYKCAHCVFFHYQKVVVEQHTLEKHPEKRYYVHTVREPKADRTDVPVPEEPSAPALDSAPKVWKCGLCFGFQSFSRVSVIEHVAKSHGTKSKYKCKICDMKSNHYQAFFGHYASKHPGEKVSYVQTVLQVNSGDEAGSGSRSGSAGDPAAPAPAEHFDTTPLWQRGAPRVRHIRGILIEEEEVRTKKSKRSNSDAESEAAAAPADPTGGNAFYCPLCNGPNPFTTRDEDCFRSHLYHELNYQQFACMLCGKMFVDRKDYERHHAKMHPDRPQSLKQTKDDGEISFWVEKVIARHKENMEKNKKRQLSEDDSNDLQSSVRKKKKAD